MSTSNRSHLSDLRGAMRMTFDAAEATAEVVETMHRTIQMRPNPLGTVRADRTRGITGFVYRCVRGGIRLVGKAIDASLAPVAAPLPGGDFSPARDAFRSVANGVYGDYLARTGNPLAINMSLRYRGQRIDPGNPAPVFEQHRNASEPGRILLLVHGSCMNDRHWYRDGHDHGAALAGDLGYLPLYLRYNSGLHIASNGRLLAELLETLIENCTTPVEELAIIGHSMGGLVARSACHHGRAAGHTWPTILRKLVFLGTPHHGSPLERAGHGLDRVMQWSPYSRPIARLSKARSAGITDLRHGIISVDEQNVPLPSDVKCYAAAAVIAAKRNRLSERLVGDGLVPLDSALGRHRDAERTLAIPESHQWVGFRMGHRELLSHPDVYSQLHSWLKQPA